MIKAGLQNLKSRITKQDLIICSLIFLASVISKIIFIGTRDIALDEPFTIFHAQLSLTDILSLPAQNEPNPPLFMFLLHIWMEIFGSSAIAIRLLPLLFNGLTAVGIYKIGRKFFDVIPTIIAVTLFLFSTYHFYFGLETRAYSLLSMGTAFALYFYFSLVKAPKSKFYLVGLITSNFLLIYSHYFGWFVVFIQLLSLLLHLKNKEIIKATIIEILITGILFIPMAVIFIKQFLKSSKGTWLTPPQAKDFHEQLGYFINSIDLLFIVLFFIAAGILAVILDRKYSEIKNIKLYITLFLWWVIPYCIMFFVSDKIPMFLNRYILFNSIGFYLFIGASLFYLYKRNKYLKYIIIIPVLLTVVLNLEINSKTFYYREVKNSVAKVKEYKNDETIVIIYPHWAHLGFMYYYDKSIYQNTKDYDSLLAPANIFPCWDKNMALNAIKNNPNKRIILYEDGGRIEGDNPEKLVEGLDYEIGETNFFPQCFNVTYFDKK